MPPDIICLFAQYHSSGTIPPHTRAYLAELAGFTTLHVALAGIATIAPDDAAFLAAIGATAHPRPNQGLDFAAWAALLPLATAPFLLLANDSVFGPYGNLPALVAAMQSRGADAWGLVESHERVPHLQSWFVCLRAALLAAPPVRRVFGQDFAAMTKDEIILHGELGLSVALRAAGATLAASWPAGRGLRRLIPVNPAHFDYAAMLATGRVPFVKTELLRDNPANLPAARHWRAAILAAGGDPARIDHALGAPNWQPPLRPARLHRRLLNAALASPLLSGHPGRHER